ncbi:hypothetical protein [Circoviridae sp.]|nr:hypothetical protein [Circoviridae sp.]UOF81920.1 hypothetical protein [Circoviridae sp.]
MSDFSEPDSPTYVCFSAVIAFFQALAQPRRLRYAQAEVERFSPVSGDSTGIGQSNGSSPRQ